MVELKFQLLAVVLLSLSVLIHAEKPKCEELESEFHLYECRPLCATINGRHGRKGGGDIENISDDGTCEKGLKCCIVSYYHDFVGDIRLIDKLDKTPWDD